MAKPAEEREESQELFEHHRIVVDKGQSPLRIDKFLMTRIENATRNKVQLAAKSGNILVNNSPVKQNYKVKPGEIISVVLTYPPREIEIIPEDIPLQIIHEDSDILVVHKRPGMVVHPAYANFSGTLVNALAFHLQNHSPDKESDRFPFLVHRIDKDTSGILVIAKNEDSQSALAKEFFNHTIERKYHALVWGDFDDEEGAITGNIGRSPHDRRVYKVYPDGEYGKHAVTHYRVLERFGYVSLLECKLETGRTHQIRVHLKYIGHPLFGDKSYGGDQILKGTTFTKYRQFIKNCFEILPRQGLHAKTLSFTHPGTKQVMSFDTELPEDMSMVIDKWRRYVSPRQDLE